jgi:hypothetical protein
MKEDLLCPLHFLAVVLIITIAGLGDTSRVGTMGQSVSHCP